MEAIHFRSVLPLVFEHQTGMESDVWNKDVTFEKGKLYLVEADSGKGKSTFCSYVVGFRHDFRGSVLFDERNVASLSKSDWVDLRLHHISHLFQELRLFPELTALENVDIKNNLTGFKSHQEIMDMFERVGISDKMDSKVGLMSFGQQQRVAMIRALVQPFDFILVDEPISHLDDTNSAMMADIMMQEAQRQGAGVIVTSIGKHMDLNYDHILKL
ncbi:MAG: ATP-binding cassette domain-containing protein [Prevotella sp.]|nr:ATP-binding cassette domain-containing protein [Prevotella sp.]